MAKIIGLVSRNPGQDDRFQNIDTGIGQVGKDLLTGRFLDKADNHPLLIKVNNSPVPGIGHLIEAQRSQHAGLAVKLNHRAQIGPGEHIAVIDQKGVVKKRLQPFNPTGRTQ